jgi:hypothetical protein
MFASNFFIENTPELVYLNYLRRFEGRLLHALFFDMGFASI